MKKNQLAPLNKEDWSKQLDIIRSEVGNPFVEILITEVFMLGKNANLKKINASLLKKGSMKKIFKRLGIRYYSDKETAGDIQLAKVQAQNLRTVIDHIKNSRRILAELILSLGNDKIVPGTALNIMVNNSGNTNNPIDIGENGDITV